MRSAIISSFVFLGLYALAVWLAWSQVALFFFGLSPFIVLWVVYQVLKDPHPVQSTFDNEFYQDGSHPRSS